MMIDADANEVENDDSDDVVDDDNDFAVVYFLFLSCSSHIEVPACCDP